jgi:hypothetical protein
MRAAIGLTLVFGLFACSAGSSDSTTSGGSATAGTETGTTGGDTGGDAGDSGGTSGGTSSGGMPVTGTPLGQICDQLHACHDAQDCVSAGGSGSTSFCTIECGVSKGTAKVPPDGGPQLCAQAPVIGGTPATGGTPACDLTVKNKDGTLTWDCGLECGTAMGMDYGGCPSGLSCSTKNICQ